jgi:hypothetical protein
MRTQALPTMLLLAAIAAACGRDGAQPVQQPAKSMDVTTSPVKARSLCDGSTGGFLAARLRGDIDADVHWREPTLECEGGLRPDGRGVRAAFAGEIASAEGKSLPLRFIFGIDLADTAPGAAQVLPTNLTVILEGQKVLYSTHGDERCAAEITLREPLPGSRTGLDRLSVRGYCLGPAEDAAGENRLLIPTFEFTGIIRTGEDP